MEANSIDELYKRCSEKHSLAEKEFCSLEDFYQIFQIDDEKMLINLMNLTCVKGNKISPKKLREARKKLFDSKMRDGIFHKNLCEFTSLAFLLSKYPEIYFKKSEKPDFILRNEGKEIGLEVTSSVSNIEAQVNKVIKYTFGRNKKNEEIQEYIHKNYSNIVDKVELYNINGVSVLSPSKGLIDCHAYKDEILRMALTKAEKIKNYFPFSEMWVLIDTKDNGCFTEASDAKELSELFIREDKDLISIDKIIVINVLNKACLIYDVKSHEFKFIKNEG